MENALEVKGLCKQYNGFALRNVSFTLPRGRVMGFIGENGAGKTTTIKTVLGLTKPDAGEIRILGMDRDADERAVKEHLGVVLEDSSFLYSMTVRSIDVFLSKAYAQWNSKEFFEYMDRFGIDEKKKVKEYSKGMRMKVLLAAALSHSAELLLLDEPTNGLDPIVRDEVLDILYEFMQDESHAILLSSHITSDLDKIADSITLIHKGRIVLSEGREELLDNYSLLRCTSDQLAALPPRDIRALRRGAFGCEALIRRDAVPKAFAVESATIEEIMLLLTKGETTQ